MFPFVLVFGSFSLYVGKICDIKFLNVSFANNLINQKIWSPGETLFLNDFVNGFPFSLFPT